VTDHPRRYLVAYDISDDHRRIRIANVLSAHGDRVQFSVFVVDCRPARMIRVRAQLARLIKPGEDSILICDLGLSAQAAADTMQYLGARRTITSDVLTIV
jgi:CRISPR-associated protein Cas2